MRQTLFCLLILSRAAWSLAPPTQLTVVSATNKQVQLSWTPAGADKNQYLIERRTLDSTVFSTAARVTPGLDKVLPTTFADINFDQFTPYVYRVRAANTLMNPVDTSDPTNEVTVGPPPYGYTRVVATPDKLDDPGLFNANTQIILDRSGDPMLCYLNLDPNLDANFADTEIRFVRWDRAHYTWTTPVVAAITNIDNSYSYNYSFRLAVDPSTGTMGIVFVDTSNLALNQLSIVDSTDNGLTWRKRNIVSGTAAYLVPAIALGSGQVYLTFTQDYAGIQYMTGKLTDSPSSWTKETVPNLGFTDYGVGSDIALDSEGKPAIVYAVSGDDYREIFYRPGSTPSVANISAVGFGENFQMRLAFAGTRPRIAFTGSLDSHYFEDYDHTLFVLTSPDSGVTWNPRVNIRSDGNRFIGGPIDLAINSSGGAAITSHDSGGNFDREVCGYPKLSLSSDFLNWSTCGITSTIRSRENSSAVRFALNDLLYLTISIGQYPFDPTNPQEIPAGLYFWRGPIGFQFPAAPVPVP